MRTITALLALGLLAACGRVGPPRPPGPADQITFPRPYPAREPAPTPTPTPTPSPTPTPAT
jgi:predicted small lipoprotein YifL